MTVRSQQLDSALRAAGRGWRVFPVAARGKRPLVAWRAKASCEPEQIRSWWSGEWSEVNIGAVVPQDVVVLDIDPRHGGDAVLEQLESEHGTLPRTLTAITGSGGLHFWFDTDETTALRQGADTLGRGLDTRCAGRGFVVIPCSVHRCGARYRWASGDKAIAPAPAWLVERLRKPSEKQTPTSVVAPLRGPTLETVRYALAALRAEAAEVASAKEGTRNDTLNRAAFRMRRFIDEGQLDAVRVTKTLTDAAQTAGLDLTEALRTIASGLGTAS
jgi:hypothetical protein